MDKQFWIKKLQEELVELLKIQDLLLKKNPPYPFLYPTVENAMYAMANLLTYLEGKNPHLTKFSEPYFHNRNISMHKSFFQDLHTNVEDGLKTIIKKKNMSVSITKKQQAESIVRKLTEKVSSIPDIEREKRKILELGGTFATFNDHLNTILNSFSLPVGFVHEYRLYFDGINILRNKVSHPNNTFSETEKEKLTAAKLNKVIADDGQSMQMTFEGYKLLIMDMIRFFDELYKNV